MTLFVDTSVWSLAFRRDAVPNIPEVNALKFALESGQPITTAGFILQELLQGFSGAKAANKIVERFSHIPLLTPDRHDHIGAAELHNLCRRAGVQVGTIDAIIAQLCIRHELTLLTTDNDFTNMRKHTALRLWQSA